MMCPGCEVWELGGSENFCSWCGLAFLKFEIHADRLALPGAEYPPPIELTVSNLSRNRDIDVQSITSPVPWIALLDRESIPQRVAGGERRIFLLDVDTMAAPCRPHAGEVYVHVAYAAVQSIILEIV